MSLIFMLWAFVLVGIKWGWWVGALLAVVWFIIPGPSKIDSLPGLIASYIFYLAIRVLGAYATALVFGEIWGAVVAVLVGVNEIVIWGSSRRR